MTASRGESSRNIVIEDLEEEKGKPDPCGEPAIRLRRWLVSFSSGREWYTVGEFVALDASSAVERAIDVFGGATDYQAEQIPWDAAPLRRPRPREN
jgi:hypothetical protein